MRYSEGASLSVTEASRKLKINRTTLSRLLNGHAGISAEMALRLSKLLPDTDMILWMNLQRDYDISMATKHANKIHVKPLKQLRKSWTFRSSLLRLTLCTQCGYRDPVNHAGYRASRGTTAHQLVQIG